METFYIRQNDTSPDFEATLVNGDGSPANLTGYSVFFEMAAGGINKIDRAATIVSAPEGTVKYVWQSGDTDTPGNYLAEFRGTNSTGKQRTWPNAKEHQVNVIVMKEIE